MLGSSSPGEGPLSPRGRHPCFLPPPLTCAGSGDRRCPGVAGGRSAGAPVGLALVFGVQG